ncbi:MAG: uroporphyrinogen-III C-methyltransferase [Chloroflexi bacterium]|nr:uroporphyrinogen-III C-methyltransferase [Chloroflexota bacterium]
MTANPVRPGTVVLVGAGPGDPGLITVRGLQCLESADVIVYDRLVDRRLVDRAKPTAERVDAGKVPGGGGKRQDEINRILVDRASNGKRVVRLKGGDPFVFGRGGEEAEALQAEGIPFEVVPGVTSAVAVPAYAGIPLTHRDVASSFTVVTGSETPDKDGSSIDWDHLARLGGTLVVLMGWENLPGIVGALTDRGYPRDTPVALVRWGTEPCQETVIGTVGDIVDKGVAAGLEPPVVAVFGEVVGVAERLRWFDNRPLFGKRVLVTRTRAQAGALSDLLVQRGARAIELPTIEVQGLDDYTPFDGSLRRLGDYDWAIFASANAVMAVFERLASLGLDARAFGAARVGAIGPATAAALRDRGIVADLMSDVYTAEGMVRGLARRDFEGAMVFLPRADVGRETLERGLSALGANVEAVVAYRTAAPEGSRGLAQRTIEDGIDVAAFTSSSTVTNLIGLLDGRLDGLSRAAIACIGPVTAATAREVGLNVDIVASEHTVAGLVDSLETYFTSKVPSHE